MKRKTALILLLLGLMVWQTPPVFGEPQPLVVKVSVEGNKRIGAERILAYLRLRKGYRYDPEVLNADVQRLWQLPGIEHVEADVKQVAGGVEVVFNIREKQQIEDIVIEGNHKVWRSKLRDAITHPKKGFVKTYVVKQDIEAILSVYHERGYLFTRVDAQIEKQEGKQVLVYKIDEGPKSVVRHIVIRGNKFFKTDRLMRFVDSSRRRFPSFIFRGYFDKERFQQDIDAILKYYRNNGFLDGIVGGYQEFSADLKTIKLVIVVYEGRRYYTEWVKFGGNTLFADDELAQAIPLRPGRPFSPEKLLKARLKIGSMYGEIGHLDADPMVNPSGVTTDVIYEPGRARVKVTFNVYEGPRVFLRRIRITGNTKTKQNVIRRELTFYPGEAVNMKKVRESQQELYKTGYFDMFAGNPVDVTFEPEGEAVRDAIVKVKEGDTGRFEFGVGYSTTNAVIGDISFTDRNFDIFDWPKDWQDIASGNAFRGAGQVIQLRAMPGSRGQTYIMSFDNPSVWDTRYSFGTTFRFATTDYRNYDDRRIGAEVRGGYRLTQYEVLRAALGIEHVKIGGIRDEAPQVYHDAEGSYVHPYVRLGWQKDKVKLDFPYLPVSGYQLGTEVTFSMLDIETIRWTGSAVKYYKIWNPSWWGTHVLSLRANAGVITGYGDDVPVFERFFAGGIGSLRGFKSRGIGPYDFARDEQVGGRGLFLMSVQYGMPLAKNYLRMVVFTDAGWLGPNEGDMLFGYDETRMSVGVGLRLRIPAFGRAVFAFDYAMPVIMKDHDDKQNFQWAITGGSTF